jgi:hypothetical protein
MNRYEKMFVRGALKLPAKVPAKTRFRAASSFRGPKELLLDGYMTPVEDQGSMPWCAAYSASTFAEAVLWRKNGYHKDIDPGRLYRYAKTIDGDPNGDGTYLECALEALRHFGHFPGKCEVKVVQGPLFGSMSGLNDVKYAIHKYGCCIAGFNISASWFSPRRGVVDGQGAPQGGHAVTICGYDEGGVLIQNSWGRDYGHEGRIYLPNSAFEAEFMYAAVLTHCLDD